MRLNNELIFFQYRQCILDNLYSHPDSKIRSIILSYYTSVYVCTNFTGAYRIRTVLATIVAIFLTWTGFNNIKWLIRWLYTLVNYHHYSFYKLPYNQFCIYHFHISTNIQSSDWCIYFGIFALNPNPFKYHYSLFIIKIVLLAVGVEEWVTTNKVNKQNKKIYFHFSNFIHKN